MGKDNKDLMVNKLEEVKTTVEDYLEKEVKVTVEEDLDLEVKAKSELHEKYDHYIKMAKDGFIRDITYNEMMEMVQHIQKVSGRNYPFNPTCATCILSMVLLFDRLI
jgi:hypothetical protein